MVYQCRDCSYKGKQFPGGSCPGCGSLNVGRLQQAPLKPTDARPPYRLALCVSLWFYLFYALYDKVR